MYQLNNSIEINTNDNKYKSVDDTKKYNAFTKSSKFTPFTIDNILAADSSKLNDDGNHLGSTSWSSETISNPVRPMPMRAMVFPFLNYPYCDETVTIASDSSNLTSGAYAKPYADYTYTTVYQNPMIRSENGSAIYLDKEPLPTFGDHSMPQRNRRRRTVFTDKQVRLLKLTFEKTHYPDINVRKQLAKTMNLNEEHVDVWFKNRRALFRKSQPKDTKGIRGRRVKNLTEVLLKTSRNEVNSNNTNTTNTNDSQRSYSRHRQMGFQPHKNADYLSSSE